MLEGSGKEVTTERMIEAITKGHEKVLSSFTLLQINNTIQKVCEDFENHKYCE
jgi:hypothetical protein